MKIPSKILFLNILDSQPTLQRPNLSWQQDSVPDREVWVKHIPQKTISRRTHAGTGDALKHTSGKPGVLTLSLCQEITNIYFRSYQALVITSLLNGPVSHPSNFDYKKETL